MEITTASHPALLEYAPEVSSFRKEVLTGLRRAPQKTLPCKYFYDARGSRLFDQICELEEYYLTRTEMEIMTAYADEMAEVLGPQCLLVELGSGSSLKTHILLDHLQAPAAYVPVDISREHLLQSARRLMARYGGLAVYPVYADYSAPFELPALEIPAGRTVVYFPGSTIGNMSPEEAVAFLQRMGTLAGPGSGLLVGVDLIKEVDVLEAAYNDAQGATAAFNRNILRRINRELGADFDLNQFAHWAFYNEEEARIESHLVSQQAQQVQVDGEVIAFEAGETIHTENSYKYSLRSFAALADQAGYRVEQVWTDERRQFSVQFLRYRG